MLNSKYTTKYIKVSEPFPHVLHIELARPPVNAFTTEFWREYGRLFDSLTADGYDVRAAVISSVMPKIFTAGIDFSDAAVVGEDGAATGRDNARSSIQMRKKILEFQHAISAPERAPFPVIVALHGHVIGLGVDLIGACDIRYAASDTSFVIKEVDLGLAPDIGSLSFIPKVTGNYSLVRELTYTARPFNATEADKLGLISKVVPGSRGEAIKEALTLAKLIASKSPLAVASSKHLISHSRDHSVPENLAYTSLWNSVALMTKDVQDQMLATARKAIPKFAPLTIPTKMSKL